MNKLGKFLRVVVACSVLCISLVGCDSKRSVMFNLDSGEKVEVEYSEQGGNSIYFQDENFFIGSHGKKPQITGYFTFENSFEYFSSAVESDDSATLLGFSDDADCEFLTYSVVMEDAPKEYVHMYRLRGTDVFVVLVSFESEEVIYASKDALKFSVS